MREIPHTILHSHISIVNILGRLHNPLQAPEHRDFTRDHYKTMSAPRTPQREHYWDERTTE